MDDQVALQARRGGLVGRFARITDGDLGERRSVRLEFASTPGELDTHQAAFAGPVGVAFGRGLWRRSAGRAGKARAADRLHSGVLVRRDRDMQVPNTVGAEDLVAALVELAGFLRDIRAGSPRRGKNERAKPDRNTSADGPHSRNATPVHWTPPRRYE